MTDTNIDVVLIACNTGSMMQNTPLASACLSAELPEHISRQIINLPPDFNIRETVDQVLALHPKALGFSCYVWNHSALVALAHELRHELAHTLFICGGPEVSADIRQWTEYGLFDVIVGGYGERLFNELMEQVYAGTFARKTDPVILLEHKEIMPGSAWLSAAVDAGRGVLLETARGCPFSCAYCYDGRGSRTVVKVSYARLRQELELFSAAGVEQVWVLDSSFNVPASRGKELLELFVRHAPGIHYHLEAKAEYIDAETAELLQQIPCSVQVGLQSIHTDVLNNVNRRFDPERFEHGLFLLNQHGVTYGIDLIYGLPGDTYAGLRASLLAALSFYPNQIDMFALALLPGTELEKQKHRFNLTCLNEPPYSVLSSSSMDREAFIQAAKLTTALNLFYNSGRALAYFDSLCCACGLNGVEFLEQLLVWLEQNSLMPDKIPASEWSVEQAHCIQQDFVRNLLNDLALENLVPAAEDVINFNYHYSNTLLKQPLGQMESTGDDRNGSPVWRLSERVSFEIFAYAVEHYIGGAVEDLVEFAFLHTQEPCAAVFYRTGTEEVICEGIPVEVVELYHSCEGAERLPKSSAALDEEQVSYWINSAVSLGILYQSFS